LNRCIRECQSQFCCVAYKSLGGSEGATAECNEDARQTRRCSRDGHWDAVGGFSYKLFKTGGGAYLVLLCHGKEQSGSLLAVPFAAVWYLMYKCTSLTSEFTASKYDINRTRFASQEACVVGK
jgi:hypothetical protein